MLNSLWPFLAKGMVKVPQLVGLLKNVAITTITNSGLNHAGNSSTPTANVALDNTVASQDPVADTLVNYESDVTFVYYTYVAPPFFPPTPAPTPAPVAPPYFVPPFFPPSFTPAPTTPAPATPAPTTPAPTTPAPTTPAPTTPAPTTPAPVATVYWYTGCCNGTQVTGTSTIDFNAAFSSMNSQCGSTITDQQSGVYSGTSNIPTLACSSTPAPTTPAPATPAPTTPAPAPNAYWYTGCCSTTGQQVTGTSSSDFTAAYNSMLNQCSGSVTNQQSGVGGTVPSISCTSTPAPTTPAPVALTYCPSLGYNVPSSGYPGNCPGASTPAPTTPAPTTPAPTTPAPTTPAPTTPAPTTPAPTTPAPTTPAPVELTYCPSLGYNVPSSGYPGNCPGASTPAPTAPPYFVPPFFPPYFVPPFFPPSFTPAPATPAPATPAPTTPAPATPAPATPAPATPAPVALTYCPSLGYNVPSSGYPGNCPGARLDFNLIK